MSHSSGINVSSDLLAKWGEAKSKENTRYLKVQIVGDQELICSATEPVKGSWEDDFDSFQKHLTPSEPCYILYRLDTTTSQQGYSWVFIAYVPDKAKVREKMVYSSTKANLKMQLGGGSFGEEIFGTVPGDLSLAGYKKYVQSQRAEAPLTKAEQERKEEEEQGVFVGGGGTRVAGVTFPVDDNVIEQLKGLKSGKHTYVQLVIDPTKERIQSGGTKNITVDTLDKEVPIDEPRFHFFNYKHEHKGQPLNSIIYIFSSPDGSGGTKSAPVKLRMLYSSSKANVANIATTAGLEIASKVEVNRGSEVTEESLNNSLHPPEPEQKKAFARPQKPGRGPARLTANK